MSGRYVTHGTENQSVWDSESGIIIETGDAELLRDQLNSYEDRLDALKIENDESDALNTKLGDILTLTANALKGEPDSRSLHDWSDLPRVANALRQDLAAREADLQRLLAVIARVAERGCVRIESTSGHDEVFEAHAASVNECAAALVPQTPTAALVAFGERCVAAGQKDAFDEMTAMDAGVPRTPQDPAAIVARVMGGGR